MRERRNSSVVRAVVGTPLAPVRVNPDHRAEQVSQEILGSVVEVLDYSGDWVRCRGEDGYEGWLHGGGLIVGEGREAEAWWDDIGGKPAIVLDATFEADDGSPIVRLPWGARVALAGSAARLPDGRAGRLTGGRWVTWEELVAGYPQTGDAVVETAREWAGVPYVWGGRTRWGTDCSGLVQAVYKLHGFLLPRDSYQQAEIGEPVDVGEGYADTQPGDLLFFRAVDAPRITHVALSLGGAAILHAAGAHGLVAEDELTGGSPLQRSLTENFVGGKRLLWSR